MKTRTEFRLAFLILLACLMLTGTASAQEDSNSRVPLAFSHYSSCAGEEIYLTGEGHFLLHFVTDGHGGGHTLLHVNYQGVAGVGLTSGRSYRVTAINNFSSNVFQSGLSWSNSYVDTWRLIGTGGSPGETLHVVFKVTVNANGELTAFVDHADSRCG